MNSQTQEVDKEVTANVELPAHSAFAETKDTMFRVQMSGGRELQLQLTDVSDRKISERQEQYSITFRGPLEIFLPQGIYRLEHASLGSFDVFIVPIGKNAQGFSYEAVFNYLRHPA